MNAQEKKGYDFTCGAILAIGKLFLITLVIMLVMNFFGYRVDSTDFSAWERSGMSLHTDAKTGLQYLSKDGALIPRLDKNGRHMSIKNNNLE